MKVNSSNYVKLAMVTDAEHYGAIGGRAAEHSPLLHAQLGICSEAGEIADAIKKHVIYGQELNVENLIEEAGDLMWYVALLLDVLGEELDSVLQQNIEKLKKRYPEGFSEFHAKERLDKKGGK